MSGAPQSDTRPRLSARRLLAGLAVLAGGALACEAASRFIAARFPDRPVVPDLLLEIAPFAADVRHVTAAAMVAGALLFAYYALRFAPKEIPRFAAVLGIMYLLRAAIMVLTPLAHARGGGPPAFPLFQHGMFPSGHTAAALLFAFLTDAGRAPRLRVAQFALLAIVIAALLISRGHYSIDIVGGALLAYFVDREWTNGSLFDPVKRFVGAA